LEALFSTLAFAMSPSVADLGIGLYTHATGGPGGGGEGDCAVVLRDSITALSAAVASVPMMRTCGRSRRPVPRRRMNCFGGLFVVAAAQLVGLLLIDDEHVDGLQRLLARCGRLLAARQRACASVFQ
jgi:hypothetical protein